MGENFTKWQITKLRKGGGEWHKYKLVVEGMQAVIFVNDKEPFEPLKIAKGFEKGRIGLR